MSEHDEHDDTTIEELLAGKGVPEGVTITRELDDVERLERRTLEAAAPSPELVEALADAPAAIVMCGKQRPPSRDGRQLPEKCVRPAGHAPVSSTADHFDACGWWA